MNRGFSDKIGIFSHEQTRKDTKIKPEKYKGKKINRLLL